MLHHRLFLMAAVAAAAAACAPVPVAAPTPLAKTADFEAEIAKLETDDPRSPETLNLHLDYADFLLGKTEAADCRQLLAAAQSELDSVAKRPQLNVLLPLAQARIADDEYRIHLGRATCGSQTPLAGQLQQALEAAEKAVSLYRGALDYRSAAVMQFNVAATYQKLGDAKDAVPALEAAIAMDRDYGFRDDATDNTRLLLAWKGEKASGGAVAALMKDFPVRTADFQFHWPDGDAGVNVAVDDTSIIRGDIIHSQAAIALKRQVHLASKTTGSVTLGSGGVETADVMANLGRITVSYEPGTAHYDLGVWPAGAKDLEWPTLYFLASALWQVPAIQIGRDGDFDSVADPETFARSLAARVSAQILAQTGKAAPTGRLAPDYAIMDHLNRAFSPDFIESRAAEDYGLQTATWMGAKLEQGVWYQMSTPLFLPGLALGHYLVQHQISFAFTREVPCSADSPDHLCAEIVVHAIPDPEDLKSALEEADPLLSAKDASHCWTRMDLRLVIDPTTLLPYTDDTREVWYDAVGKKNPIIESIRTVSTYVYHCGGRLP